MRLINTDTLVIEEFGFGEIPNYAILSHRWYKYELNLQDVQNRIWENKDFTNENKIKAIENAFEKINQCCDRAKSDAFQYVWIDSCCIDKTSSAELSEAINSMYLWYYKAGRCYAYLSDVQSMVTFQESEWFKRGWTLQELLAPAEVFFLDKDWNDLGTKKSLQEAVSDQTRIPVNILSGADLETATVAQRMSWASRRKTTRIEDRAYCLMGIFGVNMPLLYGEGERAFIRLQEEIMKISNDHSIFAWRSRDTRGGLLATSPDAFSDSDNIIHYSPFGDSRAPLTVSSRGIHSALRFIGLGRGGFGMAILHCARRDKTTKPLAIYVRDTALTMELFERVCSETFENIDFHNFRRWRYPIRQMCIRMGRMGPIGRPESPGNQHSITGDINDHNSLSKLINSLDIDELFRAAQAGDPDIVWLWLTRGDITADMADGQGRTVLWHAVMGRHEALVKMLLARSDVNADFQDNDGQRPLSWAAQYGYEAIVKLLLEKEVDIEARYQKKTPLLWAVMKNHETIIKMLLENEDYDRQRPLLLAVEKGHGAVVKLLLEKNADTEAEDKSGRTPLFRAVEKGHKAIVKLLLENNAKADAEAWSPFSRQTPLLRAAEQGLEAVVKLLLENNADIEAKDLCGRTPLFLATMNRRETIVRLLLEKGADIEVKDKVGRTPLLQAVLGGHRILWYGHRAFGYGHKALLDEHEAVVKQLLENGADIDAKDEHGETLRLWAERNHAQNIIKLLARKV
ncbi:hypothetical protein THAR02_08099 [Trichoderma harzianum]|uniref:Uncharacterized protein n=1 Tax=Trichoderma harzianum TaxID=5544 RepID=A0A0F9X5B9_TRIHA|nr:hypothetical protein THAR02_08099 [Trichoderma harzianum]